MLKETRRDTPICIIIFTRYITPVIRLSRLVVVRVPFHREISSLARTYTYIPGRVRLSHACEAFSRGEGTATRESRGATRALRGVFWLPTATPNAADLCLRELTLLSPHVLRRTISFVRREMIAEVKFLGEIYIYLRRKEI